MIASLLSGIMFTLALHWPAYHYWMIFFFLMPIFYCRKYIGFFEGLLWGFIVVLPQGIAFCGALKSMMNSSILAIIFSGFAMALYAFYAGCSFACASLLVNICPEPLWRIACWIFVLSLFIFFIDEYLFFWFSQPCGYGLVHPLLALVDTPILYALKFLPKHVMVALLVGLQALIVYLVFYKKLRTGGVSIIATLVGICWFGAAAVFSDHAHAKICWLQAPTNKSSIFDCAQEISELLQKAQLQFPDGALFAMPEGAFPFPLNEVPFVARWWLQSKKYTLLIGAHRQEGSRLFNSVYQLNGGRIVAWYDKRCLVPCAEYCPLLIQCVPWCQKKCGNFMAGVRTTMFRIGDELFEPCICAELFFNANPKGSKALLFFMNDQWFNVGYFKELLYRFIKFKAFQSVHFV